MWLDQSTHHGTKTMIVKADAADLIRFDATIDRVADDLKILGDPRNQDQRRAAAFGVLADPQTALNLRADAYATYTGQPMPVRTGQRTAPHTQVSLYVHLTDDALRTNQGVARVEGIGPVTTDQIRRWLNAPDVAVVVKPVIDLNNQAPVDGYEIPDRLREAVHLITPTDVFPHATNKTRRMDLDHTSPLRPGWATRANRHRQPRPHDTVPPPDQNPRTLETHPTLPRHHVWQTPHGRHLLVDHTGTTLLRAA